MYITYYLHYKGYNYVHYTPLKERGGVKDEEGRDNEHE